MSKKFLKIFHGIQVKSHLHCEIKTFKAVTNIYLTRIECVIYVCGVFTRCVTFLGGNLTRAFLDAKVFIEIEGTRYLSRVRSGDRSGPGRSHPCRGKTKPPGRASGCWQDTAHTCHWMRQLWRSQADILQTQGEIRFAWAGARGHNSDFGQHPVRTETETEPVHSRKEKIIRHCVNFSPCQQDNKVERTCYYVEAKGQIETNDKRYGRENRGQALHGVDSTLLSS